ncbi:MAG: hypothetical protein HYZ53_12180 [Planctomycetes bacterium]|nr:hypothetical protein [Planctomycetota bacterium]
MPDVRFQIQGEDAEAVAGELSEQIRGLFGESPARSSGGVSPGAAREGGKGVDPVAVAALVLSIPGAILATMDLAQRLQAAERVRKLIAWAKERLPRAKAKIDFLPPAGGAQPLQAVDAGAILDAAAARPAPREGTR